MVADCEADLEVTIEDSFRQYPAIRSEPEPELVSQAARLLIAAQRPFLIAGGGVAASKAGAEIVKLAETLSMPTANSVNAKWSIPENHPLSVRVVGTYSRKCAKQIVSVADFVLFMGSHAGGQVTHFW